MEDRNNFEYAIDDCCFAAARRSLERARAIKRLAIAMEGVHKKSTTTTITKTPATATRTKKPCKAKRANVKEITATYQDTLQKTEKDIIRHNERIKQLDDDIKGLILAGAKPLAPLLVQKRKEREEEQRKLDILKGIRDRCKKQLGKR